MTESGDDCRQTGLAAELPNRYPPAACPQVEAAPQQRPNLVRLGWQQRAMLALLGGALFILLAIAVVLQPDRSGFGTHRQLGMPRCTFLVIFGYRCPSCGIDNGSMRQTRNEVADPVMSLFFCPNREAASAVDPVRGLLIAVNYFADVGSEPQLAERPFDMTHVKSTESVGVVADAAG